MYGIEIRFITEILGMQPITSVPEMPGYIKGITNLRGKIIPVMDARMRFGKELREYDDRTCIIVIDTNITTTGLIVDRVLEVVSMSEEDIAPPLDIGGSGSRFIKGFGKSDGNVKLLIDCTKLLAGEYPAL
jgi:purine-binding chemotaxis protein CheW